MNTQQIRISGWNLNGKHLPEWLSSHLGKLWQGEEVRSAVEGKLDMVYLQEAPVFPEKGLSFQFQTPAGTVAGLDRHGKLWLGNVHSGLSLEHSKKRIAVQMWGTLRGLEAPLHVLMLELLRFSGFVPLRGTVITRNGLGYLQLGSMDRMVFQGYDLLCEGLCWYSPRDGRIYGFDPASPSRIVSVILHQLVVLNPEQSSHRAQRLERTDALSALQANTGTALFQTNRQHTEFLIRDMVLQHGVYHWAIPGNRPLATEQAYRLWERSSFSPRKFAI
ncbi:hypothetical protein [Deinococcus cellulosilyticus]|uniref:Uncharacterized protein n=1 Tax=Deinococcus cellulosilyticus (strain DSM 18568 / NBRC 106333 / KACC 11606 / 5516J-15) TaxID=1223518 RepID=A0A511N7U8_DEIC1|nr:hypothetical protein [Deinococcus cellulosilyticus]GEM48491.1 hypothetical protein DC3_41260 [Deinococcus cellulosilyticus NBRC 106333 = KACC 11606]